MGANPLLDTPGIHTAQATVPAHAAATATEIVPVFRAEGDVEIVSVDIIPGAAITGADSNTTHFNLLSYTDAASPAGTERANKDFVNAIDAVALKAIRLYAPASPLALSAGQYLAVQLEKVGNGLALPNWQVITRFRSK